MRNRLSLTLALLPAFALVAQAPAPLNFSATYAAGYPAVEAALKGFQPAEALAKAEAMLPAQHPEFDKADANKALRSSIQFSDLSRLYHLAGRAAVNAGDWAKARDYFVKALDIAKENHEKSSAAYLPVIKQWEAAMADAKSHLTEGAERLKELKALAAPSDTEKQELDNFDIWQKNVTGGEKVTATFNKNIGETEKEVNAYGLILAAAEKALTDEKTETDRDLGPTFKGVLADYLEAAFSAKNVESRTTKGDKLNYLHRLLFRVQAENIGLSKKRKTAKQPPLAEAIQTAIEKVIQDGDPFAKPAPVKKAPGKKAPAQAKKG